MGKDQMPLACEEKALLESRFWDVFRSIQMSREEIQKDKSG